MDRLKKITNKVIYPRKSKSYKGNYGRALLIGGNERYGGAIMMAASACLHSGIGLLSVATDSVNHTALHAQLPEAMVLDWDKQEEVLEQMKQSDVILIGSGMGLAPQSVKLLDDVLQALTVEQYLVIDASALTLIAENEINLPKNKKIILTPHQKEWERVSGIEINEQTAQRNQERVEELAVSAVIKSENTQLYIGDLPPYTLTNGTPAMATGGMGDCLAGMITGFLGQFKSYESVVAASFLHSEIASTLAKEQYVVLPSDLAKQIPFFMKRYESE